MSWEIPAGSSNRSQRPDRANSHPNRERMSAPNSRRSEVEAPIRVADQKTRYRRIIFRPCRAAALLHTRQVHAPGGITPYPIKTTNLTSAPLNFPVISQQPVVGKFTPDMMKSKLVQLPFAPVTSNSGEPPFSRRPVISIAGCGSAFAVYPSLNHVIFCPYPSGECGRWRQGPEKTCVQSCGVPT